MANETYYPSITQLIVPESIPENLGFFQEGIDKLLSNIFYKDMVVFRNKYGDKARYDIKILLAKTIGIDIAGTGLALRFNPAADANFTELPVTFEYQWEIIKYINAFNVGQFDFSAPKSYFDLLIEMASVSEEELLLEAINLFVSDPINPIQKWVDDFNEKYPLQTIAPTADADFAIYVANVVTELSNKDLNAYDIIFSDNLQDLIPEKVLYKLEKLFSKFLGAFTIDKIKELLIPQFSFSLNEIKAVLDIPSSVLRKVDHI